MNRNRIVTRSACGVAISLMAFSLFAQEAERPLWSELSREEAQVARLELQLELSRARLEEKFIRQEMDAEQRRDAWADWDKANRSKMDELEEARKELWESENAGREIKPPVMPELVPVLEGSDPEEFIEAAQKFMAQTVAALEYGVEEPEELEDLRARFEEFDKQPYVQNLQKEIEKAHKVLSDRPQPEFIPPTAEELAAMNPVERIREEIFAKERELMREPLREGEKWRDRMAPMEEFIAGKERQIEKIRAEGRHQRALTYIQELEQLLNNEN